MLNLSKIDVIFGAKTQNVFFLKSDTNRVKIFIRIEVFFPCNMWICLEFEETIIPDSVKSAENLGVLEF